MACRTFTVVWNHRLSQVLNHFHYPTPKAGGCTLWDLMPDNLRWSWCNTDRNKVHNECHALEILKPSPAQTMEKWSSTKLVPGAKKVRNRRPPRRPRPQQAPTVQAFATPAPGNWSPAVCLTFTFYGSSILNHLAKIPQVERDY